MFLRQKKNKTGFCLQLVESYRDYEGAPRQRVVLSLGQCNLPKHLWKPVVEAVENERKGILTLFPPAKEVQHWAEQILSKLERKNTVSSSVKAESCQNIQIRPTEITHRNTRELGPSLVALHAWNILGMPDLLTSFGFSGPQQRAAALSVINRLVCPCAEYSIPQWVKTTALGDLLGTKVDDLGDDQFYRIADKLHSKKDLIESALCSKEENLFQLQRTIFLYDLTNTYFEGAAKRNPKAKRGHSKERRSDAPLISTGLVLDAYGFAIQHKIFPGNVSDCKTLLGMVNELNKKSSCTKPLVVVDSGMASEENLSALLSHGYNYIVVGKRPTRMAYAEEFQELDFAMISGRKNKPPVHIAFMDKGAERIILCKSEQRAEKEKAIFSKAEERYLRQLRKLQERVEKGRLQNIVKITKKLGKLEERNPRIARYYSVQVVKEEKTPRLEFKRQEEITDMYGCYHLRSSRQDISPEEIWRIYMMLTRVEGAFKALKSHLGLRPIFHQREDRCDSHILITVLAYHLLQWIEFSLQKQGDMRSWTTIRRILQTHAYTTVILPSKNGNTHHLRIPSTPDTAQKSIYKSLGVRWDNVPRFHTVT